MPCLALRRSADSAPVLARRIAQLLVGLFLYGIAIALIVRGEHRRRAVGRAHAGHRASRPASRFGLITILIERRRAAALDPAPAAARRRHRAERAARRPSAPTSASGSSRSGPRPLGAHPAASPAASLVLGVATGLYIGARFGPGPRDGLMTGLHRRTGWRDLDRAHRHRGHRARRSAGCSAATSASAPSRSRCSSARCATSPSPVPHRAPSAGERMPAAEPTSRPCRRPASTPRRRVHRHRSIAPRARVDAPPRRRRRALVADERAASPARGCTCDYRLRSA